MEDKERTIYCGNLSDKVTEDLLYELFLQAGPLEHVTIPKDKDGRQRNFAFIAFKHSVSVPYSIALMNGISLYGKPLRLDARSGSNVPNPYLEQLQQYALSVQQRHRVDYGHYQQNDNRYQQNDNRYQQNNNRYQQNENRQNQNDNRHHDSRRRNGTRTDNQMLPGPMIYPNHGHSQPHGLVPQMPFPPPMNVYPYGNQNRYESYPSMRSGYRH